MRSSLEPMILAVGCRVLGVGRAGFNLLRTCFRRALHYSLFIIHYSTFLLLFSLFISCTTDPKFQQYFVEGEQLYQTHCSNCHQKNGKGLGLVYPPLGPSDYMDTNPEKVMCLMKRGISGEITVNGKSYNQAMPGIPSLTELEIAEISTFIYNSWGHEKGLIEVNSVSKGLKGCPSE
jgi:cytochrome c551